jgi:hypothetical protein
MASVSDVENGLVALIGGVIYPTGQPPSVLGYPVKIYPGWPNSQDLDNDVVEVNGVPNAAHVSIYPLPNTRNTTRYHAHEQESPAPATTYTLTAAGAVITVGGAAPVTYVAQNLAAFLNGKPYVVQATAGQTAAQVAAALYAAVLADFPSATISGAAITVPATTRIGALRVGSTGSWFREVRRQERRFQISTWASSPASRAAVSDLFDPLLADTQRFTLPDGSVARLRYEAEREDDFVQKQRIYRRSLIYCVEYPTTLSGSAAQIVAQETDLSAADGTPLNTSYS